VGEADAMIELIVVILILMAIVGSLRQPRTFAEAEYRSHVRRNNLRFFLFLVLFSLSALCVYAIILGMRAS
jgi:hypothetical protein